MARDVVRHAALCLTYIGGEGFIANSLKQQVLDLEEIDDGVWSIYFFNVLLARVDEPDYVIRA